MKRIIEQNINTREYWDKFATESYLNADKNRKGNICRFANILEFIPDNVDILDVGCLNGNFYNVIKESNKNINSFQGIDISEKLIDLANKRFPEQKWSVSDCHQLPFSDDSFDVALALEVIEHIEEPRKMLSEIKRVVRKNGFIIITTPNNNLIKDPTHVWSYSTVDVFQLLTEISKNIQILTVCSANRYILAKAIIDYSNTLPR